MSTRRASEATTDWTYVRFHGPEALVRKYWGRYGPDRLRPAAERLRTWLDQGLDAYAYFNNDYCGYAVQDGRWLADQVAVAAPHGDPA